MTSLAVNNGWTPELIARDKAMKEKYGPSAHITPAKTYAGIENPERDSVEIGAKKSDKKVISSLLKGGLALGGAYAVKKSLPSIFEGVLGFLRDSNATVANSKPLKRLRDAIIRADMKLFNGSSKLSKFIQKHFSTCSEGLRFAPRIRIAHIATQCVKFAGVGLAIYGAGQLIKGVINAISNKVNK